MSMCELLQRAISNLAMTLPSQHLGCSGAQRLTFGSAASPCRVCWSHDTAHASLTLLTAKFHPARSLDHPWPQVMMYNWKVPCLPEA